MKNINLVKFLIFNLIINYYVNNIRDFILRIKIIKYSAKISYSLFNIFNKIEIKIKLIKIKKKIINLIKNKIK